jgi:hypothetical protein
MYKSREKLLYCFQGYFDRCVPYILEAEVVQLVGQSTEGKPDEIKSLNDKDLVEIQNIKISLVTFIKSPIKSKTTLLSSKFKKIYKNTEEVLSAAFDKKFI